MLKLRYVLFILLILFQSAAWAEGVTLSAIQLSKNENTLKVRLRANAPIEYHAFSLKNPDRIVIDFKGAKLLRTRPLVSLSKNEIKAIRSGFPVPSTLRIVIEVARPMPYQIFIEAPFSKKENVKPSQSSIKTISSKRQMVVVIDAGHGGKDPGAVGENGVQEKNVVLAIAKKLATRINESGEMRAVLTRQGDYFVGLRDRLKLARKGKADLFIAIHADSYFNTRASGASVYTLSRHGATTEAARWLARRDNYSELGGVDLGDLPDQSVVLRSVLIDLAQTATITDSMRLGTSLLDALDNVTSLHYTRVEQAPFVVLKSPDIPSVLVETGFITNRTEEKRLADNQYQNQLADALYAGVQHYVKRYAGLGVTP